jgi:F0F1-type ATP synthase membrane subunit b/b'
VLADIALRLDSSRLVGMSLVMAVFLIVAYGMLYTVLQAALDERDLQ